MRELTMNYGPVFTVNDKQFIAETTMDKDLTMSYNYLKVRVPYTTSYKKIDVYGLPPSEFIEITKKCRETTLEIMESYGEV